MQRRRKQARGLCDYFAWGAIKPQTELVGSEFGLIGDGAEEVLTEMLFMDGESPRKIV